jgi:hypothetical protein
MNKVDINKVNFSQLISNQNGKTSATAVAGLWLVLIGSACFCFGVLGYLKYGNSGDAMLQSLGLATLGTSLLVTKRLKPTKDTTNANEITNT